MAKRDHRTDHRCGQRRADSILTRPGDCGSGADGGFRRQLYRPGWGGWAHARVEGHPERGKPTPPAPEPTPSFVPTDEGNYQLSFTVTEDGSSTTVTQTVTVSAMALQADPLNPGKSIPVIGGTTDDDTITVLPGSKGSYEVTIKTGRSKVTQKFTPSTALPDRWDCRVRPGR